MSMQSAVHAMGVLLGNLLSSEEEFRRPAEASLQQYILSSPSQTFHTLHLLSLGAASFPLPSRSLALLLLRRQPFILPNIPSSHAYLSSPDAPPTYFPFDALTEEEVGKILGGLLGMLEGGMRGEEGLRRGVVDVVGKWVEEWRLRGHTYPPLLPTLLKLATSPQPLHRLSLYTLIHLHPSILYTLSFPIAPMSPTITTATTSTPSHFPNFKPHGSSTSTTLKPLTPQDISHLLLQGMDDPILEIRVEAVKAMKEVLTGEEEGVMSEVEVGVELVGKGCHVLTLLPPTHFPTLSTPLISLLSSQKRLFSPHLPNLYKYLLALCIPPNTLIQNAPECLQPGVYATGLNLPAVGEMGGRGGGGDEDEDGEDDRFSSALEFLLTAIETASEGDLRGLMELGSVGSGGNGSGSGSGGGRDAVVGMLVGRMFGALQVGGNGGGGDEGLGEWLAEDDMDEMNEAYPREPEDALLRYCEAIPPSLKPQFSTYNLISQPVQQLLSATGWKAKHTGLMALSAVLNVLVEETEATDQLAASLVQSVLPLVNDPHPRVRYAVSHTIGQMAVAFEDTFPQPITSALLKALTYLLGAPEARVQCQSALSLINLMEVLGPDEMEGHVQALVARLIALIKMSPVFVKAESLTALGYVALASSYHFTPYAKSAIEMSLSIIQNGKEDKYRLLRCRAFEACGIIAIAIGKTGIESQLAMVAEELSKVEPPTNPEDEYQNSYIAQAWGKLATALGSSFEPYLPRIMPDLLKKASIRPAIQPLDVDGVDESALPAGMEIVSLDSDTRIAVDSKAMEEKALAFEILPGIVEGMRTEVVGGWLEGIVEACLGTVEFMWEPSARLAAISMLPTVLQHAKDLNRPDKVNPILTSLNTAILRETNTDSLITLYTSYTSCLDILSPSTIPTDIRHQAETASEMTIQSLMDIRKARLAMKDLDGVERKYELEEEEKEERALMEIMGLMRRFDERHKLFVAAGIAKSYRLPKAGR